MNECGNAELVLDLEGFILKASRDVTKKMTLLEI